MPRVLRQAAARDDLIDHYVYLAEEAGERTADRFMDNAEASFALLATQPEMGTPLTLRATQLAGMRKWSVKDFSDFLVFYLPGLDGVTIVRVLHATRDWWDLLGLESR
jgi:toxin ParE1/3/4